MNCDVFSSIFSNCRCVCDKGVKSHLVGPPSTNSAVSQQGRPLRANLASNGAGRRFDGRVRQPLVRLFREGWEKENAGETSELRA